MLCLKRVTRDEGIVVGTVLLSRVVQFDPFGDCDPSPSREHKGTAADREPMLMVPAGFWRDVQELLGVVLKFWQVGIDLAGSPLPVNKTARLSSSFFLRRDDSDEPPHQPNGEASTSVVLPPARTPVCGIALPANYRTIMLAEIRVR